MISIERIVTITNSVIIHMPMTITGYSVGELAYSSSKSRCTGAGTVVESYAVSKAVTAV
jgi:hypothetical protein